MKVAFFGTSAFAAGALERLVREDGIDVTVVVRSPAAPPGVAAGPRPLRSPPPGNWACP